MTILPPSPPLDPGRNARRFTIAMLLVVLAMSLASVVDRRGLHAEIARLEARVADLEAPR